MFRQKNVLLDQCSVDESVVDESTLTHTGSQLSLFIQKTLQFSKEINSEVSILYPKMFRNEYEHVKVENYKFVSSTRSPSRAAALGTEVISSRNRLDGKKGVCIKLMTPLNLDPSSHILDGNRSKAPDKKPSRIIEEIIAKYAVDANLFRLGSTNPKKIKPLIFVGLL